MEHIKDNQNQQETWDEIADSWTNLRTQPQKEVIDFAFRIAKPEYAAKLGLKKKIVDIGCGNCRNLIPFRQHDLYGVDFSSEMIKQARKFCKKHELDVELKQADAAALPFSDNEFDVVLCLATLHCLRKDERIKTLKEIHRVLKPGGVALISVWNRRQPKYFFRLLLSPDLHVGWDKSGRKLQRYYHFFTYGGLERLVRKSGLFVVRSYPERDFKGFKHFSRNIFVEIEKRR